jgi:hypothetical protein
MALRLALQNPCGRLRLGAEFQSRAPGLGWRAAATMIGALIGLPACASDHHVSPWPQGVRIDAIAEAADLGAQLAKVEREMQSERLVKTAEIRAKLSSSEPFVIQGFEGPDWVGKPRTAVRVITSRAVVLALGPRSLSEATVGGRARLLVALADGGLWRSGSDMNGDEIPDVAVAGVDGTFEIWGILDSGASPYPMVMLSAPNQALDIDDDGRPDPAVRLNPIDLDPIAPTIVEVATFAHGAYRNDTPQVRAWHNRQRGRLMESIAPSGERETLASAIERTWHAVRGGGDKDSAIAAAEAVARSRAPLGPGVSQAWVRWRGWLQDNLR